MGDFDQTKFYDDNIGWSNIQGLGRVSLDEKCHKDYKILNSLA